MYDFVSSANFVTVTGKMSIRLGLTGWHHAQQTKNEVSQHSS